MTREKYQCLVCCCEVMTPTENVYFCSSLLKTDFNSSLLSKNLEVIFVLRKLLGVPSIHLENQLKECGSDPGRWIRLCDQCTQLTRKARELDQEIKKIEKRLRSVRKEVVEKIRSSKCSQEDYDDLKQKAYLDRHSLTFEEKIRSFVKTNKYADNLDGKPGNDPNGFLEGDKLAKYLASQENSSSSKILLVEEPVNDEIKIEVESPPPTSPPPSPVDIEVTPTNSPEQSDIEVDDYDDDEDEEDYRIKIKTKVKDKKKIKGKIQKGNFNCLQCTKKFKNRQSLKNHVRFVHLKKFTIFCPICGQGCCHNPQKYKHMFTNHRDDPLTLQLKEEKGIFFKTCVMAGCDRTFLNKEQEDRHMKSKHGGDDKVKVKWKPGEDRKTEINEDGQVLCGECGKWYSNLVLWRIHFWKMHEGRDLNCPGQNCEVIFKVAKDNLGEFKEHFEVCHEGKGSTCHICGKDFLTRDLLKSHKKRGHGKRKSDKEGGPWICEICGDEKTAYGLLRYHLRNVHKVDMKREPLNLEEFIAKKEEKRVMCNLCGKELGDKYMLEKHVKLVHNKEFSVSCHVCGRGMPNTRQLNIHLLVMHAEDPVARRLVEEEGLRLIRCGVSACCGTFLREEERDKHVKRMHGGRSEGEGDGGGEKMKKERFRCKVCGKGFWLRAVLNKHERVHDDGRKGRKDFKCEICGKGFYEKDHLRGHERRVHKMYQKIGFKHDKEAL